MVGIAQFPGLGMYDDGGKFEVKQEFIDAARAKAIEEGKKYYGDATNFEVFRDGVLNLPDSAINFVARGAEGTGELFAGLASLVMKGGQLATTTDPDKLTQIMSEPSFTKYMGAYKNKIPTPNLYESNISGVEDVEKAFGTAGHIAAPIPVLPIAKGIPYLYKASKAAKEGTENIIKDVANVVTEGDSGFRASAGSKKINLNQSLFEQTTNIKPNEFLATLKNLNIEKNPEILKDFANFYDNYLYALRKGDKTKRTVSRSKERIDKFRSTVGDKKYDELINAASDAGLIKIRDMGGLKSIKSAGDDFIKQNYRNMEVDELLALMQKDAEKYFFTNSVGERLTFQTPQALNEHALRLGIKRKDVSSRLINQKILPIQKEFENLLKTKKIDVKDPIAVKKTFREAIEKVEGRSVDTMGDDFYEHLDSRRKSYNELGTEYNIASRDEITTYKGGEKYATKFLKYYQNKIKSPKSLKDLNESSQFRFFHNISRTTPDLDSPEAFFK